MSKADRRIIDELHAEATLSENLIAQQATILRKVANALHNGELKDGEWSHHDLGELAVKIMAERHRLKYLLRRAQAAGIISRELNAEIAEVLE
jgi:ribosomal silencing factor RsfS